MRRKRGILHSSLFRVPIQRRSSHISAPTLSHFPFYLTNPQILLKALLNLPATDFTLLLYILPEKLQTDVRADRFGILWFLY